MKRICVFCGSSKGARPVYEEAAIALGQALVRRGLGLVYGGGNVGLMGVIADTVVQSGGEAIGVIPESLAAKELAHEDLPNLIVVSSMHERKATMADYADGFIAMPGGFGTFEEFCEIITWAQLGFHRKPCGLLNVENYYAPMLALFDHAVAERFVRTEHRPLVLESSDPEQLLDMFETYQPLYLEKWIDRSQT
jgi:hypothetical protein